MHEPESSRASEVQRRLAQIRSLLEQADADGVVLGRRYNFAWLTAGGLNHVVVASEDGAAPILVTHEAAMVVAPINEAARVETEEVAGLPIEVTAVAWHEPHALEDAVRRRASGRVLDETAMEPDLARLRSGLRRSGLAAGKAARAGYEHGRSARCGSESCMLRTPSGSN